MTGGRTGIGSGIAQGGMRRTMALALALGEVVAVDPTMIGSTATGRAATGRAVITILLKIVIRYLPSNSTLSLLRPHL